MATVTSHWSIVPVVLKPDALEGENCAVPGTLAADFCAYLAADLDSGNLPLRAPHHEGSAAGAELARRHVSGEAGAFEWYAWPVRNVRDCRKRLEELYEIWRLIPSVEIPDVVVQASSALGFEAVHSFDRVLDMDDYMAFYRDTPRPELHPRMQKYLIGKKARLILLCGLQENSALQAMKTYLRRVMLHPTGKSDSGNWIHVTNADAANYPELMRLFIAS